MHWTLAADERRQQELICLETGARIRPTSTGGARWWSATEESARSLDVSFDDLVLALRQRGVLIEARS
jgi:hypothetical protein